MISFSFLFFFVFFLISQATCIGGSSWFEGKRSPEKRSNQCGPGCSCFKKLKRSVSFYDNKTSDDLSRFLEKRSIQCGIRWHGQSGCGFKKLRRSVSVYDNETFNKLEDNFSGDINDELNPQNISSEFKRIKMKLA